MISCSSTRLAMLASCSLILLNTFSNVSHVIFEFSQTAALFHFNPLSHCPLLKLQKRSRKSPNCASCSFISNSSFSKRMTALFVSLSCCSTISSIWFCKSSVIENLLLSHKDMLPQYNKFSHTPSLKQLIELFQLSHCSKR